MKKFFWDLMLALNTHAKLTVFFNIIRWVLFRVLIRKDRKTTGIRIYQFSHDERVLVPILSHLCRPAVRGCLRVWEPATPLPGGAHEAVILMRGILAQ